MPHWHNGTSGTDDEAVVTGFVRQVIVLKLREQSV